MEYIKFALFIITFILILNFLMKAAGNFGEKLGFGRTFISLCRGIKK